MPQQWLLNYIALYQVNGHHMINLYSHRVC